MESAYKNYNFIDGIYDIIYSKLSSYFCIIYNGIEEIYTVISENNFGYDFYNHRDILAIWVTLIM